MAVQKSKKSRSKRDMRRSHDTLSSKILSEDVETGEVHIRHNVSESGFYRGVDVLEKFNNEDDE